MGPQVIHLPDGQNITVTPVFAGLFFKSNDLSTHQNAFPIGWTIVIHTEDGDGDGDSDGSNGGGALDAGSSTPKDEAKPHLHSFTKPTLQHDSLFISSISNPSSQDFKPAASPTRQVAMMLWVTLYWYFHQPAPPTTLVTESSKLTPEAGRPRGDWRVRVKRDGVLRGRNLIPKLERMGLISSLDSAVGTALEDSDETWAHMFVSQKMFWQTPGRLFLFTLQPNYKNTRSYPGSPAGSRPGSPAVGEQTLGQSQLYISHVSDYTVTDQVRHPVRPKPPRMGEVFYTRFVPSVGQYLSLRVASLSPKPVPYMGPVSQKPPQHAHLGGLSDTGLLELWHANPRVSAFWGKFVPDFLISAMKSRHSFPVIGMWDGVPFGYFELYWVKEDILGRYIGREADDWDRGCHVLIGEEWARGRVQSWLTSLVHWALCADNRTMSVCLEPRVDNARFIQHVEYAGFTKEMEIAFPHKQAWFGRLRRETWNGPAL
ncbi:acyl-CoA N-acyltransferase [Lasiosphaeria miniovina]|uniref:Acyl-CoA N-acyltransferase n=1 Tax=Lasiosphaeria miniovina TaxID=1954250 RepID=A0AA40AAP9_9PEZI|nr:acyl-CoA N-acyltransferase [Lasiosphaeria miniovina]KAK0712418.1 acyl-CoA N-acyltransferase [Lasiosphaeria miniovina]